MTQVAAARDAGTGPEPAEDGLANSGSAHSALELQEVAEGTEVNSADTLIVTAIASRPEDELLTQFQAHDNPFYRGRRTHLCGPEAGSAPAVHT